MTSTGQFNVSELEQKSIPTMNNSNTNIHHHPTESTTVNSIPQPIFKVPLNAVPRQQPNINILNNQNTFGNQLPSIASVVNPLPVPIQPNILSQPTSVENRNVLTQKPPIAIKFTPGNAVQQANTTPMANSQQQNWTATPIPISTLQQLLGMSYVVNSSKSQLQQLKTNVNVKTNSNPQQAVTQFVNPVALQTQQGVSSYTVLNQNPSTANPSQQKITEIPISTFQQLLTMNQIFNSGKQIPQPSKLTNVVTANSSLTSSNTQPIAHTTSANATITSSKPSHIVSIDLTTSNDEADTDMTTTEHKNNTNHKQEHLNDKENEIAILNIEQSGKTIATPQKVTDISSGTVDANVSQSQQASSDLTNQTEAKATVQNDAEKQSDGSDTKETKGKMTMGLEANDSHNYTYKTFYSEKELNIFVKKYKEETRSKWRMWHKDGIFSKPLGETLKEFLGKKGRVRWSQAATTGITHTFDGVPFFCAGTTNYGCAYGKDVDRRRKDKQNSEREKAIAEGLAPQKRRASLNVTMKHGCPSKLCISRIIKFIEFKVNVTKDGASSVRAMRMMASDLHCMLTNNTPIKIEERFIVKVPSNDTHKYHEISGETVDKHEAIDERLIRMIKKIYIRGENSAIQIYKQCREYVLNELFKNEEPPPQTRRRFYPRRSDVSNIMNHQRHLKPYCNDDQEAVSILCESYSEDVAYCQAASSLGDKTTKFLFVYQSQWMKRLLLRYGQELCVIDPPHLADGCQVPLNFMCVKSNVGFLVVAIFICKDIDETLVEKTLQVISEGNPEWQPKNFSAEFNPLYRNAIGKVHPTANIHISDIDLTKTWNNWLSTHDNGLIDHTSVIMEYIHNIANSMSNTSYENNLKRFKASILWSNSTKLQNYFADWETHKEQWVKFYRDQSMDSVIYSDNETERESRRFQASYLEQRRSQSVCELIKIVITNFLPDCYEKYKQLNIQSYELCQENSHIIPRFLHNRPSNIINHLLTRIAAALNLPPVQQISERDFIVKNDIGNIDYLIRLGNAFDLPTCECENYKTYKIPCMHICAVIQSHENGWAAIGKYFQSHPLYKLDEVILNEKCQEITTSSTTVENVEHDTTIESMFDLDYNVQEIETSPLDSSHDDDIRHINTAQESMLHNSKRECRTRAELLTELISQTDDYDKLYQVYMLIGKGIDCLRDDQGSIQNNMSPTNNIEFQRPKKRKSSNTNSSSKKKQQKQ